jgi:hypothetical protein
LNGFARAGRYLFNGINTICDAMKSHRTYIHLIFHVKPINLLNASTGLWPQPTNKSQSGEVVNMPFSNSVVQAIEAGCLHTTQQLVGMGQPETQVIGFILTRFPQLLPGDAQVIYDIAYQSISSVSQLTELPQNQPIPSNILPVNPLVAPGSLSIGVSIESPEVSFSQQPPYWMEVNVPADILLEQIDAYIRTLIDTLGAQNPTLKGFADYIYRLTDISRG